MSVLESGYLNVHERTRFDARHAARPRCGSLIAAALGLAAFPSIAHASPWNPVKLGSIPLYVFALVLVYIIGSIVAMSLAVRRIRTEAESGRSATRIIVRGLLLILGVLLLAFAFMWRLGLPMTWPGYVFAGLWLALAHAITHLAQRVLPRTLAGIVSLLVTDVAAGAVFALAQNFNFFPLVPTLVFFTAYVHITVMARKDMTEKLGSPFAVALVGALVLLIPEPMLSHTSLKRLDTLDRPGISTRIPGTQGSIQSVFADPLTGYVFYVDRDDLSKIHSISPDWSKRVFFQDRRERFEQLRPGYKSGTMLAMSSSPQGRSAFLMALPDMNVRANFASEDTDRGGRQGPEAFFGTINDKEYVSSVKSGESFGLIHCQMPLDGSEPISNMGPNCAQIADGLAAAGPVIADPGIGYVYALESGSLLRHSSQVRLFNASPATALKSLPLPYVATDIAMTSSGRTLYVAATTKRKILYLTARKLEPAFEVDVDVFPTRLLLDAASRTMYVGSYIDGQIQMMNVANGVLGRPLFAGPGLHDMSLDEKRQYIYAATDVGVIRIDLSLAEQPLDAIKLESSTGIRPVK